MIINRTQALQATPLAPALAQAYARRPPSAPALAGSPEPVFAEALSAESRVPDTVSADRPSVRKRQILPVDGDGGAAITAQAITSALLPVAGVTAPVPSAVEPAPQGMPADAAVVPVLASTGCCTTASALRAAAGRGEQRAIDTELADADAAADRVSLAAGAPAPQHRAEAPAGWQALAAPTGVQVVTASPASSVLPDGAVTVGRGWPSALPVQGLSGRQLIRESAEGGGVQPGADPLPVGKLSDDELAGSGAVVATAGFLAAVPATAPAVGPAIVTSGAVAEAGLPRPGEAPLSWLAAGSPSAADVDVGASTGRDGGAQGAPIDAGRLHLQLQSPQMGRLDLDLQIDGTGQAQLLVRTDSHVRELALAERAGELVDAMRDLGLQVQVDVRHGGGQDGAPKQGSGGRGQGGSSGWDPVRHHRAEAPSNIAETALLTATRRTAPVEGRALHFYA